MKNFFKKGPLVLSSMVFLLSCLIFHFVYKEIEKNNQASEEAQRNWQTESDRRDEIKSFDRSVKIIQEDKTLLETHFAKSSDIVPFLDTLENTASLASVKAEVASVDVAGDGSGLLVGMVASGNFSAIYKFITLLENFPYELQIMSVNLTQSAQPSAMDASGKITKAPTWRADLRIKLLSFIP